MLKVPGPPRDVPYFTGLALGLPPAVNAAHEGEGWLELMTRFASEVGPQRRYRATATDLVFMDGGQGDILDVYPASPPSAAVCYQRAVDYAAAVRAAGTSPCYIVISTMPTIGPDVLGGGRPSVEELTRIEEVNDLIIANSGLFDAVSRCDTAPFDNATDLYHFHEDRTHLTVEGARVKGARHAAAALTIPAIAALV
jgi:hypothetical protein